MVRSARSWLIAVLWVCALAYGLHTQYAYATTPGAVGATPVQFPAQSALPRGSLLVFVHAECPCTRATLRELAALLDERGPPVSLVVAPYTLGTWRDSAAAAVAERIPNLTAFQDDGREATRFGALTSGFVVLYDADGMLQFAGGVTGSRGHMGESMALRGLRSVLRARKPRPQHHPVYGCPLESAP